MDSYTYPDVLIIQGKPTFQDQRTDVILNPCLIIEILSKSTKDHDSPSETLRERTDKFRYYRSIPEFREYVLIDQYGVAMEQYTKTDKDTWLFRAYESDAERIILASVEVEMTTAEIYEGVEFNLKNIKDTQEKSQSENITNSFLLHPSDSYRQIDKPQNLCGLIDVV
jgi:Uma2 family endonuclease